MKFTSPNDTDIRIRAMLVRDFKIDPSSLRLDSRLEDLGVDSIGMAELIFNVEDEFGLKLPDVAVQLSTLAEVIGFIDNALAEQRAAAAGPHPAEAVPGAT